MPGPRVSAWRPAGRVVVVCAAVAGVVILASSPVASASVASRRDPAGQSGQTWATQQLPTPRERTGEFTDVSCIDEASCVAVGSFLDGVDQSLSEVLDAGTWSTAAVPVPVAAQASSLADVSCGSVSHCVAVGAWYADDGTFHGLVETWTGSQWVLGDAPQPNGFAESVLSSVSCPTATACMAIGTAYSTAGGHGQALAEVWNGANWTILPTPDPGEHYLTAVSCVAAAECTAVGASNHLSGSPAAVVESWDGASWSVSTPPTPRSAVGSNLTGVSCPVASACMAVGYFSTDAGGSRNLVETWNGTSWLRVIDPVRSGDASLTAVSCADALWCATAGSLTRAGGTERAVTTTWDGTTWTRDTLQAPPRPAQTQLSGLSCTGRGMCTTAGSYTTPGRIAKTLVEARDGSGTWTVADTTNPFGAESAELNGASCSVSGCAAVGSSQTSGGLARTLAEIRVGKRWSITATPPPAGTDASLAAVSCPSSAVCAAVGTFTGSDGASRPLADLWDSGSWTASQMPVPPGAAATSPAAVSCPSATTCVAVGTLYTTAGAARTFAEMWDGVGWTVMATPDVSGSQSTYLFGVSCATPSTCVAVGMSSADGFGNDLQTVAEVWNGSSWSVGASPNASSTDSLQAVSCSTPTSCMAVGVSDPTADSRQPLAEHWNGTAWTITPIPADDDQAGLYGVSCPAASACTAVGTGITAAGVDATSADAWNGAAWNAVDIPGAPSEAGSALRAVSCSATTTCTAVGAAYGPGDHPIAASSS